MNTGQARIFDVVSVRDIVDTKVGAAILQNPKNTGVMGTDVSIRRNGEKHPPKIVAAGEFTFLTSKKQFVYGNLPLNICPFLR